MQVLLFADVNANLIDGSSIWMQSVALAILNIPNAELTLVVRDDVSSDLVVGPVEAAGAAVTSLAEIGCDDKRDPDAVAGALCRFAALSGVALTIVRGDKVLDRLAARSDSDQRRIWAYHIPPSIIGDARPAISGAFGSVIVQSMAQKAVLESVHGIPAAKVIVLPPAVPDLAWDIGRSPAGGLVLSYSGKLDCRYRVEEYLELPALLAERGIEASLSIVGDKFNRCANDEDFGSRMKQRLSATPGVDWHGGTDRATALQRMSEADLGLCVRDDTFASSLEVSTKLVEFCALGVPPIVNPTWPHVQLLGEGYPLFADSITKLVDCVARYSRMTEAERNALGEELRSRAAPHRLSDQSTMLRRHIARTHLGRTPARRTPRRVLIAGHDLKFLEGVRASLEAHPDLEVRYDNWPRTGDPDLGRSEELLGWADVVFCEWCGRAAVWYSRNAGNETKLIVRLHRFEAFTDHPANVEFRNVNRLIVVSDYFRDLCVDRFGVDAGKIDVLPQFVDAHELVRPKHPWADRTLGFVGMNTFDHKRPDRALDLLERLRSDDPVWRLRIRSSMPWELPWAWSREREQEAFQQLFDRIRERSDLFDSVLFDPPGPDMAEWYRNVGFVVSTSQSEGCHTAVAEGMASGAIPLIWDWPGAATVYPREYVGDDIARLAEIARAADRDRVSEAAKVSDWARRLDLSTTIEHFSALLLAEDPESIPLRGHRP